MSAFSIQQQKPDTAAMRQRFEAQLALSRQYLDTGKQADRLLLEGDMRTMPDFVALKNRQHPDLHLCIADSPTSLLAQLKTMPPAFHLRCALRSEVDAVNGWHHLYADIRRQTGGPLSILLVEPAHIKENVNGVAMLLQLIVRMLPDPGFHDKRMSCFNVAVQKSGSDCLIFCIDFALKAFAEAAWIDALHDIHCAGHAIGNEAGDPVVEQNNQDTLSVAPASLLPFSFFEHAQSITELRAIWGDDDPRAAALVQHMREQRMLAASNQKPIPSSIEYCRRAFLLEALADLSASRDQQQ